MGPYAAVYTLGAGVRRGRLARKAATARGSGRGRLVKRSTHSPLLEATQRFRPDRDLEARPAYAEFAVQRAAMLLVGARCQRDGRGSPDQELGGRDGDEHSLVGGEPCLPRAARDSGRELDDVGRALGRRLADRGDRLFDLPDLGVRGPLEEGARELLEVSEAANAPGDLERAEDGAARRWRQTVHQGEDGANQV